MIPLSKLEIGKSAKIISFDDEKSFMKLIEMGFIPGEYIKLVKKAPFGGLLAVFIAGTLFGLRKEQADNILVEEEPCKK